MKTILAILAVFLIAGCGPKNKTIGKDTDIRTTFEISNNSGLIIINPGISPTSGDTGFGDVDNLAELTTNLEDLLRIAQPGSNLSGGDQDKPTATNTIDNSQVNSNNPSTTETSTTPIVTPVVTPTTEPTPTEPVPTEPIEPEEPTDQDVSFSNAYDSMRPLGDSDSYYNGRFTFMECGSKSFDSCKVGDVDMEYRGTDNNNGTKPDRALWATKDKGIHEGNVTCKKGNTVTVFLNTGIDNFGKCK